MFYGVENKGNMIAVPRGYDSKIQHLADCDYYTAELERITIQMDVYIDLRKEK